MSCRCFTDIAIEWTLDVSTILNLHFNVNAIFTMFMFLICCFNVYVLYEIIYYIINNNLLYIFHK